MTRKPATGLQLAFLMFALTLLSVPVGSYLFTGHVRTDSVDPLALRLFPFAIFGLLAVTLRPLRSQASSILRAPINSTHYQEVVIVALAMIPLTWATTGARAVWTLIVDPSAMHSMKVNADAEWTSAFSSHGIGLFLASVLVAPLLEELVCRGFLYRAFARDWGWLLATLVTSVIFAAYHSFFLNAFAFALVMVCVMRRTGSIRAAIAVHAFSNLMVWWPLMGQYVFPNPAMEPDRLASWTVNVVSLAIAVVALPLYLWLSRDRFVETIAPTQFLAPNVPLQK